jgi:YHS domain-containing protein
MFLLFVYLGYWLFKKWVGPKQSSRDQGEDDHPVGVDDVMVKDPFCETYFPKRQGIQASIKGKTHYFCSTECRDRFKEAARHSES